MVNTTLNRLVSTQRVKTILECYGADPAAWPADERPAARALLERDHELHELRDQALQLDAAIQTGRHHHPPDPASITALTGWIMQALPAQTSSPPGRLRRHHRLGWLAGLAASLVIVGILFVAHQSPTSRDRAPSPLTQAADQADIFAEWAWEDVTGEVDNAEITAGDIFPLYALVAHEQGVDEDR